MPVGVLALGVAAALWLAVAGRSQVAGRIRAGDAACAATILGLVLALRGGGGGLAGAAVGPAAPGGRGRGGAAGRGAGAGTGRRETAFPVPGCHTRRSLRRVAGRPARLRQPRVRTGAGPGVTDTGESRLAETYGVFVAGTDRLYPAERMPIVRALAASPPILTTRRFTSQMGPWFPSRYGAARYTGMAGKLSTPSPRSPICPNATPERGPSPARPPCSNWRATRSSCGTRRVASRTGTRG